MLLHHRPQGMEHVACTRGLSPNLVQQLFNLASIPTCVPSKPSARCKRVVLDRDERLIDLVCDRRRHLTDRMDPNQMRETLTVLSGFHPRLAGERAGKSAALSCSNSNQAICTLKQDDSDCQQYLPAVLIPQARLTRAQLAVRRQLGLADPTASAASNRTLACHSCQSRPECSWRCRR